MRLSNFRVPAAISGLVFGGVVIAVAPASVAPAHAAECATPTFKFYPGSTLGKVRYGETNFSFDVCTDATPSAWKATANVSTNSTGKNLGITFDNATITPVSTGANSRIYEGKFRSSSCVPRVGFPCYRSGTYTVRFAASSVRQVNPRDTVPNPSVVVLSSSAPLGLTLYTTP